MDLLCIVGPTGVGKTKLSLELAKDFNGEIISGDAMQFYQGLDIGTAKASLAEQAEVKHHLLSILKADESFSVVEYQKLVRKKIADIKSRGKLPILVGGSGLYIQAIIEDYQFSGDKHKNDSTLLDLSIEKLQEKLKQKSPELYKTIDIKNKRRVIRALEKNDDDIQMVRKDYYKKVYIIGLNLEREKLYQRINQRVHTMMDQGLLAEVKALFDRQIHGQSIKAIGYKELYQYFNHEISLDQAISLIQRNSRRYAKRQLTWFRNKVKVNWFETNLDNFQITVNTVKDALKKNLSLE